MQSPDRYYELVAFCHENPRDPYSYPTAMVRLELAVNIYDHQSVREMVDLFIARNEPEHYLKIGYMTFGFIDNERISAVWCAAISRKAFWPFVPAAFQKLSPQKE